MIDTVTIQEAQSHIDPLLVAEILTDFATTFRRDYPAHITARGVGPEQAMIGLAIKNGHLVVRDPAVLAELPEVRALVAAALQRAAARMDEGWSYIAGNAIRALIPTDHAAALEAVKAQAQPFSLGQCEMAIRARFRGVGTHQWTVQEARDQAIAAIRAGKVQP